MQIGSRSFRPRDRHVTRSEIARDAVVLVCAASAGIHGVLTPAHFAESSGAGFGFAAATAALAAAALALTLRSTSAVALVGTAALLAGLLAAYALAVTSGVPVLHPESEPVDGLAVATKAIEAFGLLAACSLLWRSSPSPLMYPKGT